VRRRRHGRLDLGCVAAHGVFTCDRDGCFIAVPQGKAATAFLLEPIAGLQTIATVPMIDIRAYASWLNHDDERDRIGYGESAPAGSRPSVVSPTDDVQLWG
jgi:hypothetical protein